MVNNRHPNIYIFKFSYIYSFTDHGKKKVHFCCRSFDFRDHNALSIGVIILISKNDHSFRRSKWSWFRNTLTWLPYNEFSSFSYYFGHFFCVINLVNKTSIFYELWDFFMKVLYFFLKTSVNFIELCSVIARIRNSWIVSSNLLNFFFRVYWVSHFWFQLKDNEFVKKNSKGKITTKIPFQTRKKIWYFRLLTSLNTLMFFFLATEWSFN